MLDTFPVVVSAIAIPFMSTKSNLVPEARRKCGEFEEISTSWKVKDGKV
jgi:hypothetical protein